MQHVSRTIFEDQVRPMGTLQQVTRAQSTMSVLDDRICEAIQKDNPV